jgi:hypothetical protein
VRCAVDLCVISVGDGWVDSDGDGTSDDDEKAAGTDPHDASSKPPVLDLVHLASLRQLPSFELGLTHIVALPTVAPDGRSLTSSLPSMAGADAMTRLGLTSDLLGKVGMEGIGIRVGVDPTSLLGTKFGAQGSLMVGGVNVGLISAGGDDDLAPISTIGGVGALYNSSPNAGLPTRSPDSVAKNRDGSFTFGRYYSDGSFDQQSQKVGKNGTVTTTQTSYDSDLNTTGSGQHTSWHTDNPDGSSTQNDSNRATTTNDDGSVTETIDVNSTTTNPDGSSSSVHVHAETTKNTDGSTRNQTTTTTITQTGADGKTTTTVAECSNGSCSTPVTTTTDAPKDDEYVNPDADSTVIYLSDADIERVVGKSGWNTTPGPAEPIVIDEAPDVVFGGLDPSIAYIEDDPATSQNWDGVVFVELNRLGATPYVDPRLPNLQSELPPVNSCVPGC